MHPNCDSSRASTLSLFWLFSEINFNFRALATITSWPISSSNWATHLEWVPVSITTRCRRTPWNASRIAVAVVATVPSFTICWPSVRTQYALLRSPRSMPITSVLASRSDHPAVSSSVTFFVSRLLFVVSFLVCFFMPVPSFSAPLSASLGSLTHPSRNRPSMRRSVPSSLAGALPSQRRFPTVTETLNAVSPEKRAYQNKQELRFLRQPGPPHLFGYRRLCRAGSVASRPSHLISAVMVARKSCYSYRGRRTAHPMIAS